MYYYESLHNKTHRIHVCNSLFQIKIQNFSFTIDDVYICTGYSENVLLTPIIMKVLITISESLHNIRISTRDSGMGQIRFHEVCDQGIILYDNFTRAKRSRHNEDGICFMNRPMKLDEKVHIYGLTSSYCNAPFKGIRAKIRIGLTNTDPEQYRKPVYEMKDCSRELKEFVCFSKDDKAGDFFHISICLCPDATLSICINEAQNYFYKYEGISPLYPIWLVIEPFEISPIRISEI